MAPNNHPQTVVRQMFDFLIAKMWQKVVLQAGVLQPIQKDTRNKLYTFLFAGAVFIT